MNQIYLGQRAYGFASAAQIYYGKPLDKISIAEAAMLAGLPKAPSRFNPVVNPKRAKARQNYVLARMKELRFITAEQHEAAVKEPLQVKRDTQAFEVKADHLAEMVRLMLFEQYKDDIYTKGFRVYTTIRKEDQLAANAALRQGVLDYDKRHGFRGPEEIVELPAKQDELAEALEDALSELDDVNGLEPAVVLEAKPDLVKAYLKSGDVLDIKGDGLKFVQKALSDKAAAKQRIRRGAIVRLNKGEKGWEIVQLPQIEASFISLSPIDGSIKALAGGFDFARNKYNHVAQAWRQPGSSFKPFIYSAALEKGYTPATVINDAPIVVDAAETGGQVWEPKNFDGTYDGPIPMRQAIVKSKNLVSIRILQAIGTQYAQDYIKRFGFEPEKHPPYLTMALGAGSVTPLQMATGYSVFANGGYRVQPYYIERILDNNGKVLAQANPKKAGDEQDRVIDARNAYLMTSMLADVTRFGTAARAASLKRPDIAGKTGTTNDHIDAWFCGFNQSLVGVAWIGFDQPKPMGGQETGGHAALPIWMGYMAKVLPRVAEILPTPPEGVVTQKVAGKGAGGSGVDYFYRENLPPAEDEAMKKPLDEVKSQIF
jgi:penicillin-binding protein 1A